MLKHTKWVATIPFPPEWVKIVKMVQEQEGNYSKQTFPAFWLRCRWVGGWAGVWVWVGVRCAVQCGESGWGGRWIWIGELIWTKEIVGCLYRGVGGEGSRDIKENWNVVSSVPCGCPNRSKGQSRIGKMFKFNWEMSSVLIKTTIFRIPKFVLLWNSLRKKKHRILRI